MALLWSLLPVPLLVFLILTVASCAELQQERPRPSVEQATASSAASSAPPGSAQPTPLISQAVELSGGSSGQPIKPYVQKGSGVFVVPTPVQVGGMTADVSTPTEQGYTLNFVNADVREVVKATLGDLLGLSYSFGANVQGSVTLQTSQPVERRKVLYVIAEVLRLNGLAIVQSGTIYEILPAAEATGRGVSLSDDGSRAIGAAVRLIPLRYVAAQKVAEILDPLKPVSGGIRVDPTRNFIIAWGPQSDLASLAEFISVLDVSWLSGMSFGLLPLRVAEATQVSQELEQIFADNQGLSDILRIVPIDRLNSILIVAKQPAYLDAAREWVGRLDQVSDAGLSVRVYNIQNRRAAEVAKILDGLFAGSAGGQQAESSVVAPGLTPVKTGGAPSMGLGADEGFELGDRSAAGSGFGRTSAAEAESLPMAPRGGYAQEPSISTTNAPVAPSPLSMASPPSDVELGSGLAARIIADDASNALVVLGSAQTHKTIEAALKQLDTLPLQVLIEATIAEVTLNDELRYGLRWFFQSGDSTAIFTSDLLGAVAPLFPGFSYLFSSENVTVAFNALKSITDVQVISAPSLLVLDNQTARLQVGDEVPIATQSAVSIDNPDAPIVNQIEYQDTGVILRITPRVNAGGLVLLDIGQEVSDVVETTTSGIDSPTIQQRRVESTVSIQSGQTIALGGLIRDRREDGKKGIPILMDVPVLGHLFSETDKTGARTELLILLKPTVIRGQDQARAMTEELRRKLSRVQALDRPSGY